MKETNGQFAKVCRQAMLLDVAVVLRRFSEIIRFAVVGGVSFVIDFGFLVLFQELVFKSIVNGVLISTALSFSISLIIHYFLASLWVFRGHRVDNAKAHAQAGTLFVATNVVGLGINALAMWVGVSLLAIHYVPVKLFSTVVVMVWNYSCQKFLIFKA